MKTLILDLFHYHKKAIVASLVTFVIGLSVIGYLLSQQVSNSVTRINNLESASETSLSESNISSLTGKEINQAQASRPIIATVVDNSIQSRPQHGLSSADVVYEYLAEFGITRFLTLHQSELTDKLGPIRSIRSYSAKLALLNADIVTHVGGSPTGLEALININALNVDEDQNDLITRDQSRARPHNAYTNTNDLVDAFNALDLVPQPTSELAETHQDTGTLQKVSSSYVLGISGSSYNPTFTYNPEDGLYYRFQNGEAHIDAENDTQIAVSTVLMLEAVHGNEPDLSSGRITVDLESGGEATILQAGDVINAKWEIVDNQITITDQNNEPVPLEPGKKWITIVRPGTTLF